MKLIKSVRTAVDYNKKETVILEFTEEFSESLAEKVSMGNTAWGLAIWDELEEKILGKRLMDDWDYNWQENGKSKHEKEGLG